MSDRGYGGATPADRLRTNALALPIAFATVVLCKLLVFPGWIFWYFFSIPAHELGHAFFAWFGGHIAVPLGAIIPMVGFTSVFEERSLAMMSLDIGFIGGTTYWGFREKKPFLFVIAFTALVLFYRLAFKLSPAEWETQMAWGGIAGEHWIGAFFLIAFYHELPNRLRWDFFRFLFLLPAAWTLGSAYWTWYQIGKNRAPMPWGTFLDGGGDSGGDLDRLVSTGWKTHDIVSSYRTLGNACVLLVLGYYLYFLWQAFQEAREEGVADEPV